MAKTETYNPYQDLGLDDDTSIKSSDSAIQAYIDAKNASRKTRSNWDIAIDIAGSGLDALQAHRENVRKMEDEKKKELEYYEDQFNNNVLKITDNAGSLGEEYFGVATEQAKVLQQKYLEAVKNNDKETQSKLKMELNALSTSVQALKENLTLAAELKNNETLSNGRTRQQKLISATCTDPKNILFHEGEWKWRNPKYVEGGDQPEFFTQEDLSNSLPQIDEVTSESYLKYQNTMNESGMNFVSGDSTQDFNYERIKTSIKDSSIKQDNIMSIMHDDFTKRGMSNTFAANLQEHLDNMNASVPGFYASLGIDTDRSGTIGPEDWDSEEDIKTIMQAITNTKHPLYNYETSKEIVGDWLTLQARSKFYGDADPDLIPEDGQTLEDFIANGGIAGKWFNNKNAGVIFDAKRQIFWREDELESLIDEED